MFYVVGKTWCHNEPYETTVKNKYDDYETAKAAYDKLIREEENNSPQYKYKRIERFVCQDSKDENTIFTDNNNYHIDRNENNFCDIFFSEYPFEYPLEGW